MKVSAINQNSYQNKGMVINNSLNSKYMNNVNFRGNDMNYDEIKVKGPSLFNGFDGSIKGDFDGVAVDFKIDQKVLKLLDSKRLKGTYKINNETKKCDLDFKQKFNIAHVYKIGGSFGDKNVDVRFENPIIKTSDIIGAYNSKPLNLKMNRKLSNIIRNQYSLTGEINGKKVDLTCKGLFFFGGNIEGTFDGKPVDIVTAKTLNPFIDTRNQAIKLSMNEDDKEDLLFLNSVIAINDLYFRN